MLIFSSNSRGCEFVENSVNPWNGGTNHPKNLHSRRGKIWESVEGISGLSLSGEKRWVEGEKLGEVFDTFFGVYFHLFAPVFLVKHPL